MRSQQGQMIYLKNYKKPDYKVLSVDLDINLHPTATRVKSQLVIERNSKVANNCPLSLDGDELKLVSVSVEGKLLSEDAFTATPQSLEIKTPPKKKKFTVEIETEIDPTANTKLMGLYRSGGTYCTQCEAEGFRRITYFPDRPDVLAVYTTRIEADAKEAPILLGNGNPLKKGRIKGGRHYAIWHDPHPKPSYLFALVGGDLGSIHTRFKTASGRHVKLGIYVQNGKEDSADYAMDALIRSMQWDEEVFGCEYDLDVFNIVAIPDFNMGAMENKGLNVFNDKYVLADPQSATDADYANIEGIIAHEYFHNWTGNRITCRDWFQLCLKEGLTVYRDQEFSSDERSRAVKRIGDVRLLKTHQFPEDAGPLAHPVRPESYKEINNFYTATVYEKGAEIVRMLATVLGEKKFKKGMARYLKRHDGDAATIEDFLKCFEQAAKTDLSQFALWYSQAGTPLLNVSSSFDKQARKLSLEIEQFNPASPGQRKKSPSYIPQKIALVDPEGHEITPSQITGVDHGDGVFHLTKRKHKITFHDIEKRPVVSLNRGFTAPVEVNYRQSVNDLAFLALHDSDAFSRWQAYQNYATRLLVAGTKAIQSEKAMSIDDRFLDIALQLACNEKLEPAFKASILTLPGEGDLAQMIGRNVDPDAIFGARNMLAKALGKTLETERVELMKTLSTPGDYSPGAQDAGKRSFKNTLMTLAVKAGTKPGLQAVEKQFEKANNMTDRYAALQIIVHSHPQAAMRKNAVEKFYKKYRKNHLILDKWFVVQATRPGAATVKNVKALTKHSDFSFTNPNRLRSLIATFAGANPSAFNTASGAGYELVAGVVGKMDKINPQVAARLLTSFRSFRSLEGNRRKLAEQALKALANTGELSRDVEDILGRTLSD